jgi:hypothetical protein
MIKESRGEIWSKNINLSIILAYKFKPVRLDDLIWSNKKINPKTKIHNILTLKRLRRRKCKEISKDQSGS